MANAQSKLRARYFKSESTEAAKREGVRLITPYISKQLLPLACSYILSLQNTPKSVLGRWTQAGRAAYQASPRPTGQPARLRAAAQYRRWSARCSTGSLRGSLCLHCAGASPLSSSPALRKSAWARRGRSLSHHQSRGIAPIQRGQPRAAAGTARPSQGLAAARVTEPASPCTQSRIMIHEIRTHVRNLGYT
jgi:hypothetical protein